ncbi:FecR family protein [Daejeonella lutea]|uniref:FecR family protein n=1 Tax=Daejeonella lutea TaxID=572036 RepID=A0A1T5AXR3_9SPHI|nr:FecR family protein [Daejeonella lutea]SKB39788.1 FecR family protein [Daejeonella lutea]
MKDERLNYLLEKYHSNSYTPEEFEELNNWYHSLNFRDQSFQQWVDQEDELFADFQQRIAPKPSRSLLRRIAVYSSAAAAMIIISAGLWFFREQPPTIPVSQAKIDSIKPGGNKAYLTLADGSKISLTDAANGALAQQAGIQIIKTADGQLIYEVLSVSSADQNKFNTIETPRGGQFQIVLPDGSKVWLNAASSLKYPVQFSKDERKVDLQGEGYFEIAKDRERPFRVRSNNQTVEVLGTHFNISAYEEEKSIFTTLLEGSVKILTTEGLSRTMKPGEQSELSAGGKLNISQVNTSYAVAWKEGKFIFRNEPLPSVMRKLARWYNVDVVYEKGVPNKTVWGNVSRFDNVTDILELIELSKVARFKVQQGDGKGRRIMVMN